MLRQIIYPAVFLLLAGAAFSQSRLPPGNIIPVRLDTSLSSAKSKVGERVSARVMQDVPLGRGEILRSGSEVLGHVLEADSASRNGQGKIAVRFDRVRWAKKSRRLPVVLSLRAIASFMDVEEAQIPLFGADRGTAEEAYTTEQVGGDVVYRGGGPVRMGSETVGTPAENGVLSRMTSNPDLGCRGAVAGNGRPQALWVFSSAACGAYGLPNIRIAHAGRGDPKGEILFVSERGNLHIPAGSGLLLRVGTVARATP